MIGHEPQRVDTTGRHDFDFLFGRWTVHNHRMQNPLDPASTVWTEFVAYVDTQPVLGGLGNLDKYLAPAFPDQPGFEAVALRLFDDERCLWRIWWASTTSAGQLDMPVCGRFADGHGTFQRDEVLGGRAVAVRYEWFLGSGPPRWMQSFSFDGGLTWERNWTMDWHRE
jgi:hypothetical protein